VSFDFTKTFATLLDAAWFGETGTYTPVGGSPASITLAWVETDPRVERTEGDENEERTERVIVLASDVANPEPDATVARTSTGEAWTVESVRRLRAAAFELTVRRKLVTERTRGAYRPTG